MLYVYSNHVCHTMMALLQVTPDCILGFCAMQYFDPISQKLSRLGAQNLSMSRALCPAGGKDTVNIHYHIQGTIFSPEGQSAFSQLNI
jgi:hypothetical protein